MKIFPILVPLYKSYHILDRFVESIKLEKQTEYKVLFLDNTEGTEEEKNKKLKELTYKYNDALDGKSDLTDIKFQFIYNVNADGIPETMKYTASVNKLFNLTSNLDFDRFLIFNPDCYPLEENWLTRMVEIWDKIYSIDNNIATLGTLQYGNEERTSIWHCGCFWKAPEEAKRDELDWNHNHHYNGQQYIKCDGNTGTGIMLSKEIFERMNMLNAEVYPHFISDADFCMRASRQGYNHYCSGVPMFHSPGNSSLRE